MNIKPKTSYTFSLDIGYTQIRKQEVSVLEDYSEEEWDNLSDSEKKEYLDMRLEDWAMTHVNFSWE